MTSFYCYSFILMKTQELIKMRSLLPLLYLLCICFSFAFTSDPQVAMQYTTCDKIKPNIGCKFKDNLNQTCYSILGSDLPFSCWGAPCSNQNEAYWLGVHGFYNNFHFFELKNDVNQSTPAINYLWPKFAHMLDQNGSPIDDGSLEELKIPMYAGNLRNEKYGQNIVPLICDPKANLYCETSFHLGVRYHKYGQALSECLCHPLYSVLVEREGGGGGEQQTYICLSRPNTPCGFEVVDGFSDEINSLKKLNATFLRDGTFSRCMKNSKCLPFRDEDERNDFRQGKIWQGFGYSPITLEAILRTATRICKCDEGFVENKMYDCVKPNVKS